MTTRDMDKTPSRCWSVWTARASTLWRELAKQVQTQDSHLFGAGVKNHFSEQISLSGYVSIEKGSSSRTRSCLYLYSHNSLCNAALARNCASCARETATVNAISSMLIRLNLPLKTVLKTL